MSSSYAEVDDRPARSRAPGRRCPRRAPAGSRTTRPGSCGRPSPARCRRRRAGRRPPSSPPTARSASRASVSSTACSSSDTLSAWAARASALVALGLGDAALLGLEPRQPERRLVGERLGDQDLVRAPDAARSGVRAPRRGARRPPTRAARAGRCGPRAASRARRRARTTVRDSSSASERAVAATCAAPGASGRARTPAPSTSDAVDLQRAARLRDERGDQLGFGARRQGRL